MAGNYIDALDALTNLGAASASAIDAVNSGSASDITAANANKWGQ